MLRPLFGSCDSCYSERRCTSFFEHLNCVLLGLYLGVEMLGHVIIVSLFEEPWDHLPRANWCCILPLAYSLLHPSLGAGALCPLRVLHCPSPLTLSFIGHLLFYVVEVCVVCMQLSNYEARHWLVLAQCLGAQCRLGFLPRSIWNIPNM